MVLMLCLLPGHVPAIQFPDKPPNQGNCGSESVSKTLWEMQMPGRGGVGGLSVPD